MLVNALRKTAIINSKVSFTNDEKEILLKDVEGRYINIDAVFETKNILSSGFGIKVACVDDKSTDIQIEDGKLSVNKGKPIELNLPKDSTKVGVNIYLDGSIMEIFISKYLHDTPISYKVYSSPLPNNGSLKNNVVKVYGESRL